MAKKKPKYLVETSAVPVALGESTPAHCRHFADATENGHLHTSVYIRKEFIHRWILDYVDMAFVVDHFSNLSDALFHLNHDYSPRAVKTRSHAVALLLKEKGGIQNCRSAAKELGRLAIGELRKFDRVFRSRISGNKCGCKIGGKDLSVDFNSLFRDLRDFVASQDVVQDCPVNEFLGFATEGNAPRLLEVADVEEGTQAGKQLAKFLSKNTWITCVQCRRIGDAVIALEQPKTFCLVHIDAAFKILCAATGRPNKPISSERAIDKIAR